MTEIKPGELYAIEGSSGEPVEVSFATTQIDYGLVSDSEPELVKTKGTTETELLSVVTAKVRHSHELYGDLDYLTAVRKLKEANYLIQALNSKNKV